jgi:hypothetical protein
MKALREEVLARIPGRIVIFLDEIDAVRSLPFSTDEGFAGIRECYNRRTQDPAFERLTFCLLGVATPSDLIRDTRLTPFNIGRRIELTDFGEVEAAPLGAGLGRKEPEGRRLLERVLYWTGGHPYLTQRLCRAVAEEPSVSESAGVDRLCHELFLSPRAWEQDDNLLFVRERLLRSEAELASLLDMNVAYHDWETAELGRTMELLNAHRPGPGEEDPRGFEWFYLWRLCHADLFTLVGHRDAVGTVTFSPDGKRLATGSDDGTVKLWDATTGREAATFARHRQNVRHVQFSPDGRTLTTLSTDGDVLFWDLKTGRVTRTLSLGPLGNWSLAFSPDGRRLATGSTDGAVKLWDVATGREMLTLARLTLDTEVAFSPDGRRLAASSVGELMLWEAASKEEVAAREARERPPVGSVAR